MKNIMIIINDCINQTYLVVGGVEALVGVQPYLCIVVFLQLSQENVE